MTGLLVRTFLREHARRPLNLVLLLVVPVAFVGLAAGVIVDFASILGSLADLGSLEAATAGWAAAMLAGIGGYFQVTGSREADRRLVAAGSGTSSVVVARLASAVALAAVATVGALVALWWRAGIDEPLQVIATTAMFSLIYVGIGAGVGAVVRDELNGSLVVLFVWMFDLFLGPGFSGGDQPLLRVLPTHFPTLVMLDLDSGHSSAVENLVISIAWTVAALALATCVLVRSMRPIASSRAPRPFGWLGAASGRAGGGRRPDERARSVPRDEPRPLVTLRYGFRQYRRNAAMWLLLLGLPVAFITLSFIVTPEQPAIVEVNERGHTSLEVVSMVDVHGAIMAPITIAFLAGIAGLFVVLGSMEADRRLVRAGLRSSDVLAARMGVIWGAAVAVTIVSVAITAVDFAPATWAPFIAANVLVALTYASIGVVIGMLAGRLGGLYLVVAIPFIDVGIAQNVMFDAAPPAWGRFLPSHGAVRLLVDGAFTPTFDDTGALVLALGWLVVASAVGMGVFHHLASDR